MQYNSTKRTSASGSSPLPRDTVIGQTFSQLRVVAFAYAAGGRAYFRCLCACGGERFAPAEDLRARRIEACRTCSRSLAHARAERIGAMTREQIEANWVYHLSEFTHRQRAAYYGHLQRKGLSRRITNELRAEAVADVLLEWVRRTLEHARKEVR
jgi:hypothetical protein